MTRTADIAVAGGGLAGTAAAICMARAGFQVAHFAPPAPEDKRTSALMSPTVDFLVQSELIAAPEALGIPLTRIRIIDATQRLIRAPETLFDANSEGLAAFGWNFANAGLLAAFQEAADGLTSLETIATPLAKLTRTDAGFILESDTGETRNAALVVGADGKHSKVRQFAGITYRERKHKQSVLVCDLELGRPLEGESVEFHYENGPFTLVPAGDNKANLVWIDKAKVLDEACALPKTDFDRLLTEKAMHLFGTAKSTIKPVVFALSSLSVSTAGEHGIVLVGEAAHAFPPIGAQGLNLGLRDVEDLLSALKTVSQQPGTPEWAQEISASYAAQRSQDLIQTGAMVDTLFGSLITDFLPAQALRATGLWALKTLPGLKRRAFSLGMGER